VESAILFCNTREETERVAEMLKSRGYDADWLNGDLEQRERERVMAATREGKLRFLVATDVAARGIDISHLTHVINADFPESAEQYVHRTGRTGRAGRTGTAISIVGPKDVGHLYMLRLTYKIRPIERMLPTQGELRTRAEADMIAFLADAYAGKAQDPAHVAVARRLLTYDNAEVIIAGLLADHLGASSRDVVQDAADARRAKNPPPTPERKGGDGGHRVVHARGADPRPPRQRRPQSALASWEPAPEKDDDAPIFAGADLAEGGTKPGLGSALPRASGPAESVSEPPRRERERDRKHRRKPVTDDDAAGDALTIDIRRPPLPQYHIEDEPTVVFGGNLPVPPRGRVEARDPADKLDAPPSREIDDPAFANVFLNIGRRDGIRADDVQRLLLDKAGLAESDVGHIRLRDRITFVGIRKEHSERAIKALIGLMVGDRTLNAEPARGR
jgi:ATP-dependent RNA helicase DeaD